MRRILSIIVVLFSCVMGVIAQDITKELLVAKVNQTALSIKSIECDFIQIKHISLLKEKMTSKGKMYYSNDNRLRWEYLSPYTYCFILNDTKVSLTSSSKKDIIDIKNNQMFQEIAKIMMNSVTGRCLSNTSDFNVEISTKSNKTIAILYPKRKTLRQLFTNITLNFNEDYSMIETVELFEKSGDKTEIKLINPKLNISIDENVFSID